MLNEEVPATTPGIQQAIWENDVTSKLFQGGLDILHNEIQKIRFLI
jgi:hypothetical protein